MEVVGAIAGALGGIAGPVFDLIGAGSYTQQERAEHDLQRDWLDTVRSQQRADTRVAEIGLTGQIVSGSQATRRQTTLVLGGVLVAVVIAGALVVSRA